MTAARTIIYSDFQQTVINFIISYIHVYYIIHNSLSKVLVLILVLMESVSRMFVHRHTHGHRTLPPCKDKFGGRVYDDDVFFKIENIRI